MIRILITGNTGQLGKSLIDKKPDNCEIITPSKNDLDLFNSNQCKNIISEIKPDWLINCAAFTDVDAAENKKDFTMKINAYAPSTFAKCIKEQGGGLIQISSDYVFDGHKRNLPYKVNEKRNPLNTYGFSKFKAEESIQNILGGSKKGIIIRTSWLISPYGKNFVLTMLRLFNKKKTLQIVDDQIGCPTSTFGLSELCWRIVNLKNQDLIFENNKSGVLHWSDEGETSWFEFAKSIRDLSQEIGLIEKDIELIPVKSGEYKTTAKRPFYSVLDCKNTKKLFNISGVYWEKNLKDILQKILLNRHSHNL